MHWVNLPCVDCPSFVGVGKVYAAFKFYLGTFVNSG